MSFNDSLNMAANGLRHSIDEYNEVSKEIKRGFDHARLEERKRALSLLVMANANTVMSLAELASKAVAKGEYVE